MSESEREAPETTAGASELTPGNSGPGDPAKSSTSRVVKESRRVSSASERQIKVERAQRCLENAALVSKRIKEHRRATAELLGKTFEEEDMCDAASDLASVSTRTGYSVATSDAGPPISVEDALNIPGISESLANTLKQKEILMERIKQYKEISKRERPSPVTKSSRKLSSPIITSSLEDEKMQSKKVGSKLDPTQFQSTIKEKEKTINIMQVKMKAMETTILDLQEKITEKDSLIEAKNKATSLMSDNLSKKEKDLVNLLEDTRQQMVKMQENFVAMESEWKNEKDRLLKDMESKNERIYHLEEANSILENDRLELCEAHSKLTVDIEIKNQQMVKMQDNIVVMETEWKHEKDMLLKEIESKNERINYLEEANSMLENDKFEISQAHSQLTVDIEIKSQLISDLELKLKNLASEPLKQKGDVEEEKGSQEISNMVEMTKRLEILEQLNCQIKQTNLELENRLATLVSQTKSSEITTPIKSSPQVTRKRGKSATRNTLTKVKSPWTSLAESSCQDTGDKRQNKTASVKDDNANMDIIIQSLNKELIDKELLLSEKYSIIQNQLEIISKKEEEIKSFISSKPQTVCDFTQTTHVEETPNVGGDSEQFSMDKLVTELDSARHQISCLSQELESANKNMVRVKSAHKLKLKQMQKTIDSFSKMSDANSEVIRLSEEVNTLTQKIAELEEDKGNLQLHLVDYDSGRLSGSDSNRNLLELQVLAESRLKAISDLETQKFDLVQELHILQRKNSELEDKLTDLLSLSNENVSTEMKSLQIEEQLDEATAARKELELVIENLKLDKEHSNSCMKELHHKNLELSNKLDVYIQENIDLTERLEKLSAEKVSSAESIEIVESLTTQEKLELEEYSKKIKCVDVNSSEINEQLQPGAKKDRVEFNESLTKLSHESAELNKKIELFTLERCEVMEKMTELKLENEELNKKLAGIVTIKDEFERKFDILNQEKEHLIKTNTELSLQLRSLKTEQIEVLRESANLIKRPLSEESTTEVEAPSKEAIELGLGEQVSQDEKPQVSKIKPVKQMTKEIIKLKNVIKEREAEIADCQMKILSLEEQQQKLSDHLKNYTLTENTIKTLTEDNNQLKGELAELRFQMDQNYNMHVSETEIVALKQNNEELHGAINRAQSEYLSMVSMRDARIKELENLLLEYERKIKDYNESLQQKDKDITDYLNQISQLNNVSHKLKSTIELLEEEKLNDQNAEMIKNLNIQIINFQNLISEQETKIRYLEEEENNLVLVNSDLTEKNALLESQIRKLQELQDAKNRHDEEISKIINQCKERDEEIHEIKLQLRKESIENENLRKSNSDFSTANNQYAAELESLKLEFEEIAKKNTILIENYTMMETKNKELMDKLKKFAVNLKKKSNVCTELEKQISTLHNTIDEKQQLIDGYEIQVLALRKDIELISSNEVCFEQNKIQELEIQVLTLLQEKSTMADQLQDFENSFIASKEEINALTINNAVLINELQFHRQEAIELRSNIDMLHFKLEQLDADNKNNVYLNNKVSELELEIDQKQEQISQLLCDIEKIQDEFNTFKFGQDAKIQEKDLFIENLESENSSYRARISRLEESISIMEDKRYSLERKADQLGNQLDEKQKAYSHYFSHEDDLVNRLAVLMDHDQVIEKQLKEIEKENSELQHKIQNLLDDNKNLQVSCLASQEECAHLKDNSNKFHQDELDSANARIAQLELQIKNVSNENQVLIQKHREEMHNLETEFNIQIENSVKEKKSLTEKYEKAKEYNDHLDLYLAQKTENIKALTANLDELNKVNTSLLEKASQYEDTRKHDYTDQYVGEINNLQAIINNNNAEINALYKQQTLYKDTMADLEAELYQTKKDIVNKEREIESLRHLMNQLESTGKDKNVEIATLSSTPQTMPAENEINQYDFSLLKSEIEASIEDSKNNVLESLTDTTTNIEQQPEVCEDVIVPKKAYLCYHDTEEPLVNSTNVGTLSEYDPFKSDEGWGFELEGNSRLELRDHSRMVTNIEILSKENLKLKNDITISNTKLSKALKKLKELKINNEKLTKELKTANQLSQLNILDTTIEDELKNRIESLERNIQEISAELIKEKREKIAISKQNELFKNANDRFMDIKEKLENEVIHWKYKFKEVTDKVTSFDWGEQSASCDQKQYVQVPKKDIGNKENFLLEQIEKENDELSVLVDQLRKENCEHDIIRSKQADEICSLNVEMSTLMEEFNLKCINYESAIKTLESSSSASQDKDRKIEELKNQLQELQDENFSLNSRINQLKARIDEVTDECHVLRANNESLNNTLLCLQETLSHVNTNISHVDYVESLKKSEIIEANLQKFKFDLENSLEKNSNLQSEMSLSSEKIEFYKNKVAEFESKSQKLNAENDELLSAVMELRTSVSSAVDQRGYEVAEMWKQHLAQRESDFASSERELRDQISAMEKKYEQLLVNVQSSSQEETARLIAVEQLSSLQAKLKDKDDHLASLQSQYSSLVSEIEVLRAEMQDKKLIHESKLLNQQEENEKQIVELRNQLFNDISIKDNVIAELNLELEKSKQNNENLVLQVNELLTSSELLKTNIKELTGQLNIKDNEMYQKIQEFNIVLHQRNDEFETLRQQLLEYERKIEDVSFEKESELAVLRLKLYEQTTDYEKNQLTLQTENNKLAKELTEKIEECTKLNKIISDLKQSLQEDSESISDMKSALESQEIEIVTLKDEIDRMQILLESSTVKISKHVTFASGTKPGEESEAGEKEDTKPSDLVPRAELDLALYMLYQRDMRCEELVMELSRLLEERDTLQLRLSDSLRSQEGLRAKCELTIGELAAEVKEVSDKTAASEAPSTSYAGLSEAEALQTKLVELRSVRQSRDVVLRQDSERRELDMSLLQRDVARLPPEAVDRLRQAHYTLSRDSQSASTVLLNWLRGKSTPKVVHM